MRNPTINSVDVLESFMTNVLDHVSQLRADPDHQMFYMAKDVPVFYQYKFKELSAFKLYVWMKGVFDIQKIDGKYYTLRDIPQSILDVAYQQWEAYSKINAIEIWNDTTVASLINQIYYYYEAGLLAGKEEAVLLCDQMEEMLKIIYKQTIFGKRVDENMEPTDVDFKLYFNEVLMMNNNVLSKFQDKLIYNIPYAAVNFMSTSNQELAKDMHQYIQNQIKKSAYLTDVSERERNKFFLRLRNRIDELRERIDHSKPFML